MNFQFARYLLGSAMAVVADRLTQVQLLSLVVLSGPDGQGLGSNTLYLLLPYILFSYAFGVLVDSTNLRKLLVATSALRGLAVLAAPTILTAMAAWSPLIPGFIFVLSICLSLSAILDFTVCPLLASSKRDWGAANAARLLASTLATMLAINVAPIVSVMWLPHETLRIAALFYFTSMFLYWTLNRQKLEVPNFDKDGASGQTSQVQMLASFFKSKASAITMFRLSFGVLTLSGIFYELFLVFCLQNTQLNNAQSITMFSAVALGSIAGGFSAVKLLKVYRPSLIIGYSLLIASVACLLCSFFPLNGILVRVFLTIMGTTSATSIAAIDTLIQRIFAAPLRGKIFGALLSLTALVFTAATLSVEQITMHYSAQTIVRMVSASWLVLAIVGAFTSSGFKKRWRQARRRKISQRSLELKS